MKRLVYALKSALGMALFVCAVLLAAGALLVVSVFLMLFLFGTVGKGAGVILFFIIGMAFLSFVFSFLGGSHD